MTARIALVVPSIEDCGGVISVAEFVRRTIGKRSDLDLRLISLAMASTDSCSVRLLDPSSWLSGLRVREGQVAGEPFVHVGAFLSEIEVQRFKPRAALRSLVEDCDLIQVVAGVPSWALRRGGEPCFLRGPAPARKLAQIRTTTTENEFNKFMEGSMIS